MSPIAKGLPQVFPKSTPNPKRVPILGERMPSGLLGGLCISCMSLTLVSLYTGDLNCAETDIAIAPLRDERSDGRQAGLASFTSAVPEAQRTFVVELLRCLDVRTAGYTLANVHMDAAPTWRRGSEATQLDHILYRIAGVRPNSSDAQRNIEWLPGVTDHALVIGTFQLPKPEVSVLPPPISPPLPSAHSSPTVAMHGLALPMHTPVAPGPPRGIERHDSIASEASVGSAASDAPSEQGMGDAAWPDEQTPSVTTRLVRSLTRGLEGMRIPLGRMLSLRGAVGGEEGAAAGVYQPVESVEGVQSVQSVGTSAVSSCE